MEIINEWVRRLIRKKRILHEKDFGSGTNSAVYRNMLILFFTRWMFKKTIFHFHASGLSTHLKKQNKIFLFVFKTCFFHPDIAVHLSGSCPDEGKRIQARQCYI